MDTSSKTKALLPSIFFEFYFLSSLVADFIRYGSPENSLWLISFVIKIGLGYLAYRLYISYSKKVAALGPSLISLLVISVYLFFYISPALFPMVSGYNILLLSANTLFLFRYWRHINIIQGRLEQSSSSHPNQHKFYIIGLLLFIVWATIEVLVGVESGLRQSGVALFWITFHMLAEGIYPNHRSTR